MFKQPDLWEQDEKGEWILTDGKWMTG